ncbi:MAG: hypothetical protein QXH61_02000 [Candidatus Nezhaarchaeales archaeon]
MSALMLTSRIHREDHWKKLYANLISSLKRLGIEVKSLGITTGLVPVKQWQSLQSRITKNPNPLLLVHLTGGTSRVAVEAAKWSNQPLVLIAHNQQNSLPSALEAKVKLEALGLNPKLLLIESLDSGKNIELTLPRFKEVFKESIAMIGPIRSFDVAPPALLASKASVRVVYVSYQNLMRTYKLTTVTDEAFKAFKLSPNLTIKVPDEEFKRSLRLYFAVKGVLRKLKCSAFTFDCFSFLKRSGITPCLTVSLLESEGYIGVCEADTQAAAAMLVANQAGLRPCFMANIASVNTRLNTLTLAHCTAARTLSKPGGIIKLLPHFESQRSVSLEVPIEEGPATLIGVSSSLSSVLMMEGEVIKSSLGIPALCRTQVEVRINYNVKDLLNWWTGGHVVLIKNHVARTLTESFKSRGLQVAKTM